MAHREFGEAFRMRAQLADQFLATRARREPCLDIVRSRGQQDVAHAQPVRVTQALRVLLEIMPAGFRARRRHRHLALDQHADRGFLGGFAVDRFRFSVDVQALRFTAQQFAHDQGARRGVARATRIGVAVVLHFLRDLCLVDGRVADVQIARRRCAEPARAFAGMIVVMRVRLACHRFARIDDGERDLAARGVWRHGVRGP